MVPIESWLVLRLPFKCPLAALLSAVGFAAHATIRRRCTILSSFLPRNARPCFARVAECRTHSFNRHVNRVPFAVCSVDQGQPGTRPLSW